ncbi:MAG: hypothetical protein A2X46_08165 [Lentisphaerae bacterium GWF2_57_35]|nr:MAG: hypothetical protein A2X46_08165 [Lentisphaerae bacterium GWF2_57_35]
MTKQTRWRAIGLAMILGFPLWAPAIENSDALLAQLKYQGLASDYAAAFSTNELAELESFLNDVKKQTDAEIAVVAIPTLEGGDIDDFANRLFERWGIGKKGKDNGVLLLAALADRKIRIEVGYGLEGLFPDAKIGRILDENVLPSFREEKFARGLMNGAWAIAEIVAQDAKVQLTNSVAQQMQSTLAKSEEAGPGQFLAILIFLALLIGLFIFAAKKGKVSGGSGKGGAFPSSSNSGSSSSSSTFGGGRSGGGGASRSW